MAFLPRAMQLDEFALVGAVERFGHGVVVAPGSDRRGDCGLMKPIAVSETDVLTAPVGVMDEVAPGEVAKVHGHLERVEDAVGAEARTTPGRGDLEVLSWWDSSL